MSIMNERRGWICGIFTLVLGRERERERSREKESLVKVQPFMTSCVGVT